MVPLVAVVGGVIVVGGMTEGASLMVSVSPGVDERSGWPGSTSAGGERIGNISAVGEFNAGHGGHGLGGGGREEAVAQAEVGQCVFLVPFCRLSSGAEPSKSYWGGRVGAKRHHRCRGWMSVVCVLKIAGG